MKWIKKLKDSFLHRRTLKEFIKVLEEESLDKFLETLLRLMGLYISLNKNYRRNIENFNASYVFKSKDGIIDATVEFANSKMKVANKAIDNASITVVFKDGLALKNFLFSESPDIIGAILDSEVQYTGNLNYLSKFAYMSKHLKLQLTGK